MIAVPILMVLLLLAVILVGALYKGKKKVDELREEHDRRHPHNPHHHA
jgi:hypothetical protein